MQININPKYVLGLAAAALANSKVQQHAIQAASYVKSTPLFGNVLAKIVEVSAAALNSVATTAESAARFAAAPVLDYAVDLYNHLSADDYKTIGGVLTVAFLVAAATRAMVNQGHQPQKR